MPLSKFTSVRLDNGELEVKGVSDSVDDLASIDIVVVGLERAAGDPEKRIVTRVPHDQLVETWKSDPHTADVPNQGAFTAGEKVVLIGVERPATATDDPLFTWHGIFEILEPAGRETPWRGTFDTGSPTPEKKGEVFFA
ncbi:MAG: hypothetical protein QOJ46_2171 [bacterium]|jgi:hypothetical protein